MALGLWFQLVSSSSQPLVALSHLCHFGGEQRDGSVGRSLTSCPLLVCPSLPLISSHVPLCLLLQSINCPPSQYVCLLFTDSCFTCMSPWLSSAASTPPSTTHTPIVQHFVVVVSRSLSLSSLVNDRLGTSAMRVSVVYVLERVNPPPPPFRCLRRASPHRPLLLRLCVLRSAVFCCLRRSTAASRKHTPRNP